jgi:radical SAM protein with 4Fe4S-binding SPASM domain
MEMKSKSARRTASAPISVQLLLTHRCNLNCIYCSVEEYNEKELELSAQEWIALLKRLKESGVFTIDLSGGEIFLREDIFEILEAAIKFNFPKITITSNGTLINDDIGRRLKALNFNEISTSLDGDAESHDLLRGRDSFAKTINGIGHLVQNGIIPRVLFTPLKGNYRSLENMIDIVYPLGIRMLSFNSLHPTGKCRRIFRDIVLDCFADQGESKNIIGNIRRKYPDFKIADMPLRYHCLPEMYEQRYPMNTKRKYLKSCSAGHSSCNITSNGWVIPCSELFVFRGGNIRDQDILDIWKYSEAFAKIRDLSDVSSDQIPYCKNCQYNILCNSGCRADAYAVYGDLLAPDPYCPYWKNQEAQ